MLDSIAMAADDLRTIAFRVTPDIYGRVEQYREKMAAKFPGSKPSLSDAIRALLERALQETVPR
jgi:hypothetical protein